MRKPRPIILASLVAIAALGLLAAGCGGGGKSPGVANVASSTTTDTTTTSGSGPATKSLGDPGGGRGSFQIAMNVGTVDGAKFSDCMRKHGLTNFPDPNSQGVISIRSGTGIDPGSPKFQSARTVCSKLLPNGGKPTPAQIAQQQQKLLAFSQCMRAHGVKDFPDPSNGGLQLKAGPGSDLSPDNPTFQRAQQACQKNLPFKGGAVKAGSG